MAKCEKCRHFVEQNDYIACARYPAWNERIAKEHWCGEYKSGDRVDVKRSKPGMRIDTWIASEFEGTDIKKFTDFMPDSCFDIDDNWTEWENFVTYFMCADAKNPVKKDWPASWRNWIKRSSK